MCALVDSSFRFAASTVKPSNAARDDSALITTLNDAIGGTLAAAGVDMASVDGIGVGLPGIVDPHAGILRRAANIPYVRDLPLASRLSDRYGVPAFLGHDIDLATIAEARFGAGRGKRHILCLTVGTGIGMGIMLDGRLHTGAGFGAGNFGHMIVDRSGPVDGDRLTILERCAAGPAIREKGIRAMRRGDSPVLESLSHGDPDSVDAECVFRAAREGDEACARIVAETAELLGIGIANAVNLLAPEIVIIGGGLSRAGDQLFAPMIEIAGNLVYGFPDRQTPIVPSECGERAVILGAAVTVRGRLKGGPALSC